MQPATLSHDNTSSSSENGPLQASVPLSSSVTAIPNLAGESTKQRRLDDRHDYRARIDSIRQQASKEVWNDSSEGGEQPRIFGFCAMMFVFGQIISFGALTRGHTVAFYIGLLFTAAGLSLALISYLNRRSAEALAEKSALIADEISNDHETTQYAKAHRIGA